jgi:endonuclease/exonuclease/phosphatase family metal-dependent hydrolase
MKVLGSETYKKCTKEDCFAGKGALLVEVTMPDQKKVQMMTTHLQAWDTAKAVSVRKAQLEQVKALFKKHEVPEVAQFLIGDINIDGLAPDEYHSSLDLLQMESAPLNGEITSTNGYKSECYKTPGGEHQGQWLDHVWMKPNQSTAVVLERKAVEYNAILKKNKSCPLSDHRAVAAVISL